MADMASKLDEAIEQAVGQYFRLVILIGGPQSGKTAALQASARRLGCPIVNVNLELSKRMLELSRKQRPRQVERLLKGVVADVPGNLVLLDNLEILFDTSLEVEPLRLLQATSRNRTVIASWNGTFRDGTLTYAEPGHPEFIQCKHAEAVVVTTGESDRN